MIRCGNLVINPIFRLCVGSTEAGFFLFILTMPKSSDIGRNDKKKNAQIKFLKVLINLHKASYGVVKRRNAQLEQLKNSSKIS